MKNEITPIKVLNAINEKLGENSRYYSLSIAVDDKLYIDEEPYALIYIKVKAIKPHITKLNYNRIREYRGDSNIIEVKEENIALSSYDVVIKRNTGEEVYYFLRDFCNLVSANNTFGDIKKLLWNKYIPYYYFRYAI